MTVNVFGLDIFFGCLGGSLVLLLIIYICAIKYLKGDFSSKKEKEAALLEEGEEEWSDDGGFTTSPYKGFSPNDARGEIQQTGFEGGKFVSKAIIVVSLRYFQENRRIIGVVKAVDNWNTKADDAPKQVKFVCKTITEKQYTANTNSKGTKRNILSLSFMLGPVVYEEILNASLCIQLLGKRKRLKQKWKCYGECYINLNNIVGKKDAVEFRKNIMPKAVYIKGLKSSNTDSSDTENAS